MLDGSDTSTIVVIAFAAVIVVLFGTLLGLALWPWRIEASLKSKTTQAAISLGGGLSFAGLSASAAAILGGPGVIAVHFRAREVWRRSIARTTLDALFAWIDDWQSTKKKKKKEKESRVARLFKRIANWLIPRTDAAELPELATRVLLGLRDVSFHGAITCGFSDPALTGKTAAVLFPIAGILSPLGALDVSFDWSGKNRLDVDVELSCRVVPLRVAREILRFSWRNVHLRPKTGSVSSTLPA